MPNAREGGETIAFRQISLIGKDWANELRDELRIHLPITINLNDNVGVKLQSLPKTSFHCAPHTLICLVAQHDQTLVGNLVEDLLQIVRGSIVDDNDVTHLPRDARNDICNQGRYVVGGHHDSNGRLMLMHGVGDRSSFVQHDGILQRYPAVEENQPLS
jgi:hypothetical protein